MIEINLLPEKLKTKIKKVGIEPRYFLYPIPLIFGILICIHIYLGIVTFAKNYQLRVLNGKWQKLEPERQILETFKKEYDVRSEDAKIIQQLTGLRVNWSEKLNKLSLDLISGVWFNELSLNQKDFVLKGSTVSLQKEELGLINKFMDNLKNDIVFFKDFNSLELSSVQRRTVGSYDIVDFILQGKLK